MSFWFRRISHQDSCIISWQKWQRCIKQGDAKDKISSWNYSPYNVVPMAAQRKTLWRSSPLTQCQSLPSESLKGKLKTHGQSFFFFSLSLHILSHTAVLLRTAADTDTQLSSWLHYVLLLLKSNKPVILKVSDRPRAAQPLTLSADCWRRWSVFHRLSIKQMNVNNHKS